MKTNLECEQATLFDRPICRPSPWREIVTATQSVREIVAISTTTLIAEIDDFERFDDPCQLMADLKLTRVNAR